MATPMSAWLVARLDRAGYIDASLAASRRARATFCPDCRHVVMRGLDGDVCGLTVDCDPTPIAAEAEAMALIAGIPTYECRWLGNRYEIDRRDRWRIAGRPAGLTPGVDVLVKHVCRTPARWPPADTRLPDRHLAAPDLPDDPPF